MNKPYKDWSPEQREAQRNRVRQWRAKNPEKRKLAQELSNINRRQKYSEDEEYRQKLFAKKDREKERIYAHTSRVRRKREIFEHYGLSCACCGETKYEFLTLDHINGGGCKHRKEEGVGGGHGFYVWIIKNDFPKEFQTLCMNCNFAKGHFGECPHKLNAKIEVQADTRRKDVNNGSTADCIAVD